MSARTKRTSQRQRQLVEELRQMAEGPRRAPVRVVPVSRRQVQPVRRPPTQH